MYRDCRLSFQKKNRSARITRSFTAQLAQLTVQSISPRPSFFFFFLFLSYVQSAMPDGPRDETLGPMVPPSYSNSMSSGPMSLRMEGTAISSAVQARRRYWKKKKEITTPGEAQRTLPRLFFSHSVRLAQPTRQKFLLSRFANANITVSSSFFLFFQKKKNSKT
jgi:hypothetical protein